MTVTAKRLKDLRKGKGVTQKYIADLLGVRESSYQYNEYGKSAPNKKNLIKLAEFYKVSVDYLLGVDELPLDWKPIKKESTAREELIRMIDSVPDDKYEAFSKLLRSAIDIVKQA
ncbi:MAG: helix-turn-helix domain-containing protein [Defluviitaleaceae bacterium]|nr:helix-turn-helix domain-containing protein [Defluviitaleaceae bacterium]MCL2273960.1 helix-turn-helix domain-containing protein [Defluviitaleaceae bacterium]